MSISGRYVGTIFSTSPHVYKGLLFHTGRAAFTFITKLCNRLIDLVLLLEVLKKLLKSER